VVGWGLEEPVPPPELVAAVTSAVGTNAHTIRLTLLKAKPGQVELERRRLQDPSTFAFFSSLNEVDDTDLERDTLYRYRARFTTPPGPWCAPKEATTLPLFDAFNEGPLDLESNGWQGRCLVQRIEAGVLSRSGDLVSLTLRASSQGLSIDRIYISQADQAAGMDPYDSVEYRATMQDTVFKPPLVIPPSVPNQTKTMTLPAYLYTLDHTKPLLIAVDFSAAPASGIMYRDVSPNEARAYYKLQAPLQPGEHPEARKTDRSGFTSWISTKGGVIALIERIEVG
jgi:hypothetical protein